MMMARDAPDRGPGVPAGLGLGLGRQAEDEADQLLRITLGREEADPDRGDEVGRPGPDGLIEIRRHVAVVGQDAGPVEDVVPGRGQDAHEQAPEPAPGRGPFPEHAQEERGEERRVEEGEDELHVVHEVLEAEGDVGRPDRREDPDDRGPLADLHIMGVGLALLDVGAVDVIGPDGVERRDVAGHARHEAREQRRDGQAEEAVGQVVLHEQDEGRVVVGRGKGALAELRQDEQGDEAGDDDDDRDEHLREGGDDRGHAGRVDVLRGQGPLDDQEIGRPVAEGQHEAEAHDHAEPVDAQRVVARSEILEGVEHRLLELGREPGEAADFLEPEEDDRQEAEPNEEELDDLVVDRGRKTAPEDIEEDDDRGEEDRSVERPAEHGLEEKGHGVEADAAHEDGHDGEGDGVEAARRLVVPELEVLGHGPDPAAVVERHHEDAQEDHGQDGADPVEVDRGDAVFGRVGHHADDLEGAEVGREEGQARDPAGEGAAREEEVLARLHVFLERVADDDHDQDVAADDEVIDGVQGDDRGHRALLSSGTAGFLFSAREHNSRPGRCQRRPDRGQDPQGPRDVAFGAAPGRPLPPRPGGGKRRRDGDMYLRYVSPLQFCCILRPLDRRSALTRERP